MEDVAMKMTDELKQLWIDRAGKLPDGPNWLKDNYEAAVDRLQEHPDARYVSVRTPGGWVVDRGLWAPNGDLLTPEEARRYAFEVLAIADLAEIEDKK
jgi:hypothetical protein